MAQGGEARATAVTDAVPVPAFSCRNTSPASDGVQLHRVSELNLCFTDAVKVSRGAEPQVSHAGTRARSLGSRR